MSTEAIRKRKGREEKRRKAATAKAAKDAADAHEADIEDEDGDGDDNAEQADGNASTITVSSGSTVTPSKSSFLRSPSPVNTNLPYTISIPASSASLEWYSPKQIYTSLLSAREAGVWTYPSTLAERARCGVFKDLWKQGYFMGGGIKFGGEYLVYPGKTVTFSQSCSHRDFFLYR
jgi:tRNA-splicing endonuclease subunit Sen34